MDRITTKGREFMSRFAAPSVSSGRFVAAVVDSDIDTVRDAFEDPCPMLVHNTDDLYADKVYTGFQGIHRISEADGEITVIIDKEA